MKATLKPLSETVLRRLSSDAVTTYLGQAARYEATARPGLQLALSNEPVADMNMLIVGAGADHDHFRNMVDSCLTRKIPFLIMIYPDADKVLNDIAADLGLIYATEFPIMVRDDMAIQPSESPDVDVVRAHGKEDANSSADVLASAFCMPKQSVVRALPPSFFDTTGADVYIAKMNGEGVGTVTLTYHGETCGIWAMGTDTARQRGGIGLHLLTTAMVEARSNGIRRFFLGATAAGYPLYEKLEFKTVCSVRVWVSGETHQA